MEAGFEIESPGKVLLQGRLWLPRGEPRALVQISHGMVEHLGRYERFAQAWVEAGCGVYGHDHRGHGLTARTSAELGHLADHDGWSLAVEDLQRVHRHVKTSHPKCAHVLFGHSMGSFLARDHAARFAGSHQALALFGSDGPKGVLPRLGLCLGHLRRLVLGARSPSRMLTWLAFGHYGRRFAPRLTEFDWLTRDEEEVDRYLADPRCGFDVSTRFWLDLYEGLLRIQSPALARRIPPDLPIYLASGELDPVGGAPGLARLEAFLRDLGATQVTARCYPGARHELLHEFQRDEVTRELIEWVERSLNSRA